ncbi:MAG: gliding motility-associated ABC transporter substrate-binding protein GldG [Marinilabiliales bacterium]|nr:MAG: gliding motility-associated ABC transporter substrate-binding protein GldG [Marinilabiliales bacterium]
MKEKRNIKSKLIIQLLLVLLIIASANYISSIVFTRFDLTSEKRYTLSDETLDIIKGVDDIVYFRVYLEGDFPAGFKRLRRETMEILDEFRAYNKNIQYEFINPSASSSNKERNETYQLLVQQGLNPTNLQVKTKTGMDQQVIFPGCIITYREKELAVELLDAQINTPPEAVLNNSIQALEFKFANAIFKLSRRQKPVIAFIEGHGELSERETFDIAQTLSKDYVIDRFRLEGQINSLLKRRLTDTLNQEYRIEPKYDAIIIAKPDSLFDGKDRFIIDQYIMYGGKVLWLIDPVFASMDSIQNREMTVAVAKPLDLQSQLFTYGVKLNNDLVTDLVSAPIPLRTGQVGGKPRIDFFNWYYFPLVTPTSQHPIVRNLNAIKTQFVSSIDTTIGGVKKTALLHTSPYSRTMPAPAVINLGILRQEPDERLYRGPRETIAVLMEGEFLSDFRNRIPPEIAENKEIGFKEQSVKTEMIVISDGDMIKNQFHIPDGYPLPLGYDQYTRETYGNKQFILNALSYLVDGPGLIASRVKDTRLRLLDKTKLNDDKLMWQIINIIVPILLIFILAVLMIWSRKRKYSR